MTTYTVTDHNGAVIDSGLTAGQAMSAILTDDGHEYEIKPEADGKGFRLWTSPYSRNSTAYTGLRKSVIFSLETDAAKAEQEIAEDVIAAHWPRKPEAVTDEAHAAMMAELAADLCVLCKSADGWSLHTPGSTDEQIASGDAAVLVCGDYVGPDFDRVPQSAYAIAAEILAGKRAAPVCLAI